MLYHPEMSLTAPDNIPDFVPGNPSALFQQVSNYCVNYTEGLLVSLMHLSIDDSFSESLASYEPLQHKVQSRDRTVRHAFQFQMQKLFTDFKSIRRTRLHANRSSDWQAVGFVGHHASGTQASVEQIGKRHQRNHDQNLRNLSQRLKTLVHRSDDALDDNPVLPANLCNAFLSSIDMLGFSSKQNLLLLEMFDHVLDLHLTDLYRQLDLGLFNLDILPELTDIRALAAETTMGSESIVEEAFAADDNDQVPHAATSTAGELINQADTGQQETEPNAEQNETRAQFEAELDQLKQLTVDGSLEYRLIYEEFTLAVEPLISAKDFQELSRFMAFFAGLLDNPRLTEALKVQLTRLTQPLVCLVLVDPFFFRSSSHPVNDFLQSIIDFEIRYPKNQKRLDFLDDLLSGFLVNEHPSLNDFDPLINLYETLKDRHIKRIREEREEYQQQQAEIKQQVLELVNEITSNLVVDAETLEFFYDDWHLLLLQLARKIGMDSEAFAQGKDIAFMLAWNLQENRSPNPDYERHSFASLLKAIEKGLQSVSFPTEHRSRVRKQLIKEYKKQNRPKAIFSTPSRVGHRTSEAADQFSDTINKQVLDLTSVLQRQTDSDNAALINFLNNLQIGSWVDLRDSAKDRFKRGKLKWKSQDNNLFIFIDRRGHKLCECSLDQLKHFFSDDLIRLLTSPSLQSSKKPALGHGFHVYGH